MQPERLDIPGNKQFEGNWALAILCFVAAPVVVIASFAIFVVLYAFLGFVSLTLVPFAFFVAWKLVRLGRRLKAPSAEQVLRRDPRPPVLYLRSFESDTKTVTKPGWTGSSEPARKYWGGWSFRTRRLEEEHARMLEDLGPVITVGRPGEPLPNLGAARIVFEQDKWQEGVRALMEKAQLLVVEAGVSSGLRWELKEAFEARPFKPILLCAPVQDEDDDDSFVITTREQKYEMLKRSLPAEVAAIMPSMFGNTSFFFFARPDQVRELEDDRGLPDDVIEQIRPGTTEENSRRYARRVKTFLVTVAVIALLTMIAMIVASRFKGNAPEGSSSSGGVGISF